MLSNREKQMVFDFMWSATNGKAIDSRSLIEKTMQTLSIPNLNRHHCAGMLSAIKRAGRTFDTIIPAQQTDILP